MNETQKKLEHIELLERWAATLDDRLLLTDDFDQQDRDIKRYVELQDYSRYVNMEG